MTPAIEDILQERGARYGAFIDNATVAQELKAALRAGVCWHALSPDMKEALDMLMSKASRIVTGDPHYLDNWQDIVGYTHLVINALTEPSRQ